MRHVLNFARICQAIERDRVRAKAVIRSPRSDRLMTLHGEVPKIRPAVLLHDARHEHLGTYRDHGAWQSPFARQRQNREHATWWSRCRAPPGCPLLRRVMLRIGRGARNDAENLNELKPSRSGRRAGRSCTSGRPGRRHPHRGAVLQNQSPRWWSSATSQFISVKMRA